MNSDFGTVYVEVNYTDSNPAPIIIDGTNGPFGAWTFTVMGGVKYFNRGDCGQDKINPINSS